MPATYRLLLDAAPLLVTALATPARRNPWPEPDDEASVEILHVETDDARRRDVTDRLTLDAMARLETLVAAVESDDGDA